MIGCTRWIQHLIGGALLARNLILNSRANICHGTNPIYQHTSTNNTPMRAYSEIFYHMMLCDHKHETHRLSSGAFLQSVTCSDITNAIEAGFQQMVSALSLPTLYK